MKVGIKLVKVKKFGIGWCIPHRVVADNAKGGFVRTPPRWDRVKQQVEDLNSVSASSVMLICQQESHHIFHGK